MMELLAAFAEQLQSVILQMKAVCHHMLFVLVAAACQVLTDRC